MTDALKSLHSDKKFKEYGHLNKDHTVRILDDIIDDDINTKQVLLSGTPVFTNVLWRKNCNTVIEIPSKRTHKRNTHTV